MDDSIALLDTPKKASLQSRSSYLRGALKDFERTFAAEHHGCKPSKDDIKANAEVAGKYKEYNNIRDVLSGKLTLASFKASSPSKKHKLQRHPESAATTAGAKQRLQSTPRIKRLRPDDIDPYDSPSSVTPRRVLSAIGPTPQRDGQALGIFDLMSNPGSGRTMQGTPASRKRKIEALLGEEEDVENYAVVAQTPSQRQATKAGDILDHLTGTPVSRLRTSRHKHSRTPVSDGKKFMLSQFFATPSAVRYAGEAEGQMGPTPLLNRVLGHSPSKPQHHEKPDATPAYLRRSYSFKDRLLSASSNPSRDNSSDVDPSSPSSVRVGPGRINKRQAKFVPKRLSQFAAEMRRKEDEMHDDDLDAMREMEQEDAGVLVGDSQCAASEPAHDQVAEPPQRVWKKRGQKRSTRRVIMRPSRLNASKQQKQSPAMADEEEKGGEGEEEQVEADSVIQDELSEDALHGNPDDHDEFDEENEHSEHDDKAYGEVQASKASKPKSKKASKAASGDSALGKPPKPAKEVKKPGTINPNAVSHMNFRSLKIKNKNSKAKGRGRFGRR